MDDLLLKIGSTVFEAFLGGLALAVALFAIRRVQIAAGVKDDSKDKQVPLQRP
jgi:hypothetical protein